jgi:type II secretory pathway predicted ATPase ExeA
MLTKFYGFSELPFGVTPDARSLFLSRTHRDALASLTLGVEAGRGFLTLIAEPGMGKTTLLYQLMERLRGSARVAFLFQTQCTPIELLRYLMAELGLESRGKDLIQMHTELYRVLFEKQSEGQFVLFVDEAQNLSHETLETIRLLSNCETPHSKLIQIVLAGQPQLADKLSDPDLSQLYQRVATVANLTPFGRDETVSYIRNRLQAAGYRGGPLFKPSALELIAQRSEGVPRKINTLCFNAISLGYALRRLQIDDEIVNQALLDMSMQRPSLTCQSGKHIEDPRPAASTRSVGRRAKGKVKIRRGLKISAIRATALLTTVVVSLLFTQVLREEPLLGKQSFQNALRVHGLPDVGSTNILAPSAEQNKQYGATNPGTNTAISFDPAGLTSVTVGQNETIRQIARKHLGQDDAHTLRTIKDLNPQITDMNLVTEGESIFIPRSEESLKHLKAESIEKGSHE